MYFTRAVLTSLFCLLGSDYLIGGEANRRFICNTICRIYQVPYFSSGDINNNYLHCYSVTNNQNNSPFFRRYICLYYAVKCHRHWTYIPNYFPPTPATITEPRPTTTKPPKKIITTTPIPTTTTSIPTTTTSIPTTTTSIPTTTISIPTTTTPVPTTTSIPTTTTPVPTTTSIPTTTTPVPTTTSIPTTTTPVTTTTKSPISAKITLYGYNNGIGELESYDLKSGKCETLPRYSQRRAHSVNTYGTCVKLYDRQNCQGIYIEVKPGSSSHNRLRDLDFEKRTSSVMAC